MRIAVLCALLIAANSHAQVVSVRVLMTADATSVAPGLPGISSITSLAAAGQSTLAIKGHAPAVRPGAALLTRHGDAWRHAPQFATSEWTQATTESAISVRSNGAVAWSGELAMTGPDWRTGPAGFLDGLWLSSLGQAPELLDTYLLLKEGDVAGAIGEPLLWIAAPQLTSTGDVYFLGSEPWRAPSNQPLGQRLLRWRGNGHQQVLAGGDQVGPEYVSAVPGVVRFATSRSGDSIVAIAHASDQPDAENEVVALIDQRTSVPMITLEAREGLSPSGLEGNPWTRFRHIEVSDAADCMFPRRVLISGDVASNRFSDSVVMIGRQIALREGTWVDGLILSGPPLAIDMNRSGDWVGVWTGRGDVERPALFLNARRILAVQDIVDTDADGLGDHVVAFVHAVAAVSDASGESGGGGVGPGVGNANGINLGGGPNSGSSGVVAVYASVRLYPGTTVLPEIDVSNLPEKLISIQAAAQPRPCIVDRNEDGDVDEQDFEIYLDQYQWQDPLADVTCDAEVTIDDAEYFFLWFAMGC
jgi:hypothetical protein